MKKNLKTQNQKGMTLVELMVASSLLSLLFMSVVSALNMASVIFKTGDVYSRLNQSAMQTLRYVSREIGETSPNLTPSHLTITTDGNNNSVATFQIPVDWDNDGDVVSGTLNPVVEWGVYDEAGEKSDGNLGGWARYSLVGTQLTREVLDSSKAPVAGLSRVVANNVTAFTVTQNQNTVAMTVTLLVTDETGQAGSSRNLQSSFSSSTILRNAVN